ncbi:bifunctional metallophosphatase/5'-nucleotidase [Nonomuraea sp. NBC_01738]|uniref:bifunctional metallophosphatase/5'-nucleotidase n=1 Tax=Nonomuraea sp. NBC_01738 TaxID=2976003 RepID=UPI002E114377|nr:bifunctional metallophosphatase/5'-nucleotidase [Nonomuraea sp. NBC_01738]
MRPSVLRYALAAGVALATVAAGGTAATATPRPVDVQLLSYTDFHGYITPQSNATDGTIKDAQGNTLVVGGAAYMSTHLKQLREGKKNTITFSSGDNFSGWPTEVSYHADEPTIEFMNKIGTSFTTVGNHELDRSLEFLRDHMGKGECFGVTGEDSCFTDSDGQPFQGANFTISTANITRKGETKPLFKPYVIRRFGNVRVGFINLTTPTTVDGSTSYQPGLDNLSMVETANKYAAELKRRGVKAIVANVHEGGASGSDFNGCSDTKAGPIWDFAKNASADIDAIVTGHWHWFFNCSLPDPAGNPRPVVEAANHGRLISEINLKIDPRTHDVIREATTSANHPVTRDVQADPEMVKMVDYWNAKAKETYARPVGTVTGDLTRTRDADGESTLGNLAADVEYADSQRTPGGGADLAMVAVAPSKGSNSLRGDLKFAKGADPADADGKVLLGEAWAAWGYANPVLTVSVKGSQIEQALEQQWQLQANGTVKFAPLAVSNNVRFSYDAAKPVGERVLPEHVLINGQPLDPAKSYRLAALAYTLIGADGYTAFAGYTDAVRGERDYEAMRNYLRNGPVAPPALDRAIALQPAA